MTTIQWDAGPTCSWSDGTPDASSAGTTYGVVRSGVGQGFSLSVPAAAARALHLYVGAYYTTAGLTASLSDGSAPTYTDTFANPSGYSGREYTFTYSAAAPGQTLNITYVNQDGSYVYLNAATLTGPGSTTTTTLTHDGQGNLLHEATAGTITTAYTYTTTPNTQNELASVGGNGQPTRDFAYDKYGNTLSIGPSPTNPCPSSTSTCLGYDAQARLTSVVEPNSGPSMAMTYNAAGLRASYTVTPYGSGSPTLSEQFTYRGGQPAQTVVVSGTTGYTDTYVYSQHGMPLELLRTSSGVLNRYWYERDGLGNVVDQYSYNLSRSLS
ncbi:MAG: hypothetical protein ACRDG4_04205 [Chloroflexota bacterium]